MLQLAPGGTFWKEHRLLRGGPEVYIAASPPPSYVPKRSFGTNTTPVEGSEQNWRGRRSCCSLWALNS